MLLHIITGEADKNKEIKHYTVDFKGINSLRDLHLRIKESFEFPYYYGCNLDALWDCITDIFICEKSEISFIHFEDVISLDNAYAEKILELMYDLKHIYNDRCYDNGRIFIERNGETEEIL